MAILKLFTSADFQNITNMFLVLKYVCFERLTWNIKLFLACHWRLKVGLSPTKKICVVYLTESPLKMMKNAFYFILKAIFVLNIFKFLSRRFSHVGKTAWFEW